MKNKHDAARPQPVNEQNTDTRGEQEKANCLIQRLLDGIRKLNAIELPEALVLRERKYCTLAVLLAVSGMVFSIYARTLGVLFIGLFVSAFFLYSNYHIRRRVGQGQIREVAVICSAANPKRHVIRQHQDKTELFFHTVPTSDGEEIESFRLSISGVEKANPRSGLPYRIYFDVEHPEQLIAFMEIRD